MKNAIDEKKFKVNAEKFIKAKEFREKIIFDFVFRKNYIDKCVELGVINKNIMDSADFIRNEYGDYTSYFAMYIFEQVFLHCLNLDLETFKAFESLEKLNIK